MADSKKEIKYDEKKDSAYIVCKKCGKKVYMEGTFEYGFYFDCKCGYSYIHPTVN